MADAGVAVQTALYSRLTAALSGLSVPVFDRVPQDQAHDFVVIGEGQELPADTKTNFGVEHVAEIHVYSDKRGKKAVKQIMGAIYQDLHRQAFSVSGFSATRPQFDSEFIFPEPEGARGVIRFRLTTQPL